MLFFTVHDCSKLKLKKKKNIKNIIFYFQVTFLYFRSFFFSMQNVARSNAIIFRPIQEIFARGALSCLLKF